jgi:hypothetical protein
LMTKESFASLQSSNKVNHRPFPTQNKSFSRLPRSKNLTITTLSRTANLSSTNSHTNLTQPKNGFTTLPTTNWPFQKMEIQPYEEPSPSKDWTSTVQALLMQQTGPRHSYFSRMLFCTHDAIFANKGVKWEPLTRLNSTIIGQSLEFTTKKGTWSPNTHLTKQTVSKEAGFARKDLSSWESSA